MWNQIGGIYALSIMPERSFGRTVRYRRTRLGLSQSKLGELVGRATATIRSWERDESRPTDPKVLAALAAILGIDERHLFEKADVERPYSEENSPTVEQALATLRPRNPDPDGPRSEPGQDESILVGASADSQSGADPDDHEGRPATTRSRETDIRDFGGAVKPAYAAPPDTMRRTAPTPTLSDPSYMEDSSQRQLYRVRTLATIVGVVALVVALIWGIQQGLGAFDAWWDGFFGNLRL